MEPKSKTNVNPVIFFTLILVLLFCNSFGKVNTDKSPFSISALQYLLHSKDYVRFDWYIQSYLNQYPDSAILHILKGYRYFNQALDSRSSKIIRINDKTGGIPRKYPEDLMPYIPNDVTHLTFVYNDKLLEKAFESMEKARFLEPERFDTYIGLYYMATQTGQLDVLSEEIHKSVSELGYKDKIENMVINTIITEGKSIDNAFKIKILQILLQMNPDNRVIETELSKYHYSAGNIDSSSYYTLKALHGDTINLKTLNNAITLASIKGNFKEASAFAQRKFKLSEKQTDLEQAVLYTFTYDSALAYSLQTRTKKLNYYNDSLSITTWLFTEPLDSEAMLNKKYFSGDLFHLNLPLFSINYKRNMDKIEYYANKACAFYVYAIYDSAAYYNLNLLRNIKKDNILGYSALFNLAAEYYAAGEYRLSYFRFLALYKYYNGEKDCAVRYGLGVNYETFGDYANAIKEYTYVLQNSDDFNNNKYNLHDLAEYRLTRLRGPKKNYLQKQQFFQQEK